MKVLFLCTESPLPTRGGSPLRTWGWMRCISEFAEVGLVTLTRTIAEREALHQLPKMCAYVDGIDAPRTFWRRGRDLILSRISGTPYLVQAGKEDRMMSAVTHAIQTWKPDIIQAEAIGATIYRHLAKQFHIPFIYSAHNVEHRIIMHLPHQKASSHLMESFEARGAGESDCVVTVSEEEEQWFHKYSRKVWHIPNAVFINEYPFVLPSSKQGHMVVFPGRLDYSANIEAARILANEVFPRIRLEIPDAVCRIVGRNPAKEVHNLKSEGIVIDANPDQMLPVWANANVLICPLFRGAGTRLKLIESAASGVPMVATAFSAEGLALEAGKDYIQCENPLEMAQEAIHLLKDSHRADTLAKYARQSVERHHDWTLYRDSIKAIYEDLIDYHSQE